MFAHRSFLEANIKVVSASDHPAGLHEPLLGVQSMVTRRSSTGEIIGGNQAISIDEAFKMYTVYAAYATREEKWKGWLGPGCVADMVILASDPWKAKPDQIAGIKVDGTIVGGKFVYGE